jgi:hypothetical protein
LLLCGLLCSVTGSTPAGVPACSVVWRPAVLSQCNVLSRCSSAACLPPVACCLPRAACHLLPVLQVSELHRQLAPHMLRRLKKDVLKQLPPKMEQMVSCCFASRQDSLCSGLRCRVVFSAPQSSWHSEFKLCVQLLLVVCSSCHALPCLLLAACCCCCRCVWSCQTSSGSSTRQSWAGTMSHLWVRVYMCDSTAARPGGWGVTAAFAGRHMVQ